MPPLHSRKSLEVMKRVDLQKLCKEYGVKANLKTEDLIDLLLDSQTPVPPRRTSVSRSTPQPQPTRRSVSVRQSSQPSGKSRISSMIVHDIDEDVHDDGEETLSEEPPVEKPPTPPLVPPPRTRKAKELQTRLGKGKPVLAGGSGPRAITASGSSKGKQTKSMKPREPTIEEETEIPSATTAPNKVDTEEVDGPQLVSNEQVAEGVFPPLQKEPSPGIEQINSLMSQMLSVKSELATLQGQMVDIFKAQKDILAEFRNLTELPSIIASLQDEIKLLREGSRPASRPSTPQPQNGPNRAATTHLLVSKNRELIFPTAIITSPSLPHPGPSKSTLGKRHRNSSSSIIEGMIEKNQLDTISDSELVKTILRPDKKRAKMQTSSEGGTSNRQSGDEDDVPHTKPGSTFVVYRGSEDPDPPPTNHLPEIFLVDSPPDSSAIHQGSRASSNVPTSSANGSENQPFNFAFAPITSTPQSTMFMASFPYPEPPQSPSPAGPSLPTLSGQHQDERSDPFKAFGLPSPVRSTRTYGALTSDERGVNPAALQGTSTKRGVSSNDVAASLGLTVHRTTSAEQTTEAPTTHRTMYGTELDGDTRFGDFGVEGVASGFWSSK